MFKPAVQEDTQFVMIKFWAKVQKKDKRLDFKQKNLHLKITSQNEAQPDKASSHKTCQIYFKTFQSRCIQDKSGMNIMHNHNHNFFHHKQSVLS